MVESKEEVLVKEERWPEVTPAVIPHPIFLQRLVAASVLCFSCFFAASDRDRPRGYIYRCFWVKLSIQG
jgi:hypothetical protein